MNDVEINIPLAQVKPKITWYNWLYTKFITEKLYNWLGITLFIISGVFFAFGTAKFGVLFAAIIVVALAAIPMVYAIVAFPVFGIIFTIVLSYLLFGIGRLGIDFPLGTVMDGLEVLLIIGFLINIKPKKDWARIKGPVSTMILVWIAYNILQVLNLSAESQLAWLYTIRSVAFIMLSYFVYVYQIRTIGFVRLILKCWISLSFLAAVYACKQEFFGFSNAEWQWIISDPLITDLLFIGGHWRVFSFFSDPVVFSYNMAISSILCICLITGTFRAWKKWVLFLLIGLFVFAMLLTGTRGAFVLIPAALGLLVILKFKRQVVILALIAGVLITGLILLPTSNPAIYRFQSAFKPSEDASFQVRARNQKRIQPFILSHPFGGGLGATGVWGERFSPDSFLASFPPDSGYVRVAVELGWVGLLLFCGLMFTILYTGINSYYRIQDPELKTYCLAMILIIFALNIGNYPQEALVQFPNNVYFYIAAALISVVYQLDRQKNKQATQ
jgi:hypothetical protein